MTNKQQATIKMSIIPLVIIVALILGAGFLLLRGEFKFSKLFKTGPQIKRLQNFPTVVYTTQPLEKQRRVIKSQAELADFLKYVDSTGILTMKDSVNFEKEYLIAVSSELNPTTGETTKIKKVYEDKPNKALVISIEENVPGKTCELETDKNIGVDMVSISKTELSIKFERVKKTVECKKTTAPASKETTPSAK